MPTQEKIEKVAEISDLLEHSAGVWFVNARGLSVKQVEELRVNVRKNGGQMHVYKNTLVARALKDENLPEVPEYLSGPTSFVFCDEDVAAPAKAIKEFMKEHETLEFKGGIVEGKTVSSEEALKIADLPSKQQLIAMLLSTLQSPITGLARVCNGPVESLARAIKAIAEQKQAA